MGGKVDKTHYWLKVTKDKYELPLAVADTKAELAHILGIKTKTITEEMSRSKSKGRLCQYVKVDKEEPMKVEIVVKALKCSANIRPKERNCEDCPYRILEEVDDRFPVKPDVEIDGVKYWEECDCDKICLDAADLLEKIAEESYEKGKHETILMSANRDEAIKQAYNEGLKEKASNTIDNFLEILKPCESCSDAKVCNDEYFSASCKSEIMYSWEDIMIAGHKYIENQQK